MFPANIISLPFERKTLKFTPSLSVMFPISSPSNDGVTVSEVSPIVILYSSPGISLSAEKIPSPLVVVSVTSNLSLIFWTTTGSHPPTPLAPSSSASTLPVICEDAVRMA